MEVSDQAKLDARSKHISCSNKEVEHSGSPFQYTFGIPLSHWCFS